MIACFAIAGRAQVSRAQESTQSPDFEPLLSVSMDVPLQEESTILDELAQTSSALDELAVSSAPPSQPAVGPAVLIPVLPAFWTGGLTLLTLVPFLSRRRRLYA